MRILLAITLLLIFNSSAFARTAWVDNKAICEKTHGNWRLFNNDCANNCESKFDIPACTSISTYNCDCGKNRCWDGDKCTSDKVVKKIWEKRDQENKAKRKVELEVLKAQQELFYKNQSMLNNTNPQNPPQPQNNTPTNAATTPIAIQPAAVDPETARKNSEQKQLCEQKSGVWKEFKNGCVDSCNSQISSMSMCTSALTFGCECGESKCWDSTQNTCVELEEYKKIISASPITINNSAANQTSPITINPTTNQASPITINNPTTPPTAANPLPSPLPSNTNSQPKTDDQKNNNSFNQPNSLNKQ